MIQVLIFILSITGFFLLSGKKKAHWGFVVSLCAQPFWFYSAWTTGAWGVLALAIFYTALNVRGIRNNWDKFKMSDESAMHVVAWDENGPIEVEIVGAQPVGNTIIDGLEKPTELAAPAPPTKIFGGRQWLT